jgi:hypothetical protein
VVVWRLQTAGYAFAEDGVVIAGGEDAYQCEPGSDARSFRCSRLKSASGQRFSYTIKQLVDPRSGGAAALGTAQHLDRQRLSCEPSGPLLS